MKIRLTTSLVGHGWSANAGDLHDCSDAEASRLLAAGLGVAVKGRTTETVDALLAAETTEKPRRKLASKGGSPRVRRS